MKNPRRRLRRGRAALKVLRGPSVAGGEVALSAEHGRDDALVLGHVGAGRTQALRLPKGDRLPVERGVDVRVEHLDRETEAGHRVPVGVRADGPEVEARVASRRGGDCEVLRTAAVRTAEPALVYD